MGSRLLLIIAAVPLLSGCGNKRSDADQIHAVRHTLKPVVTEETPDYGRYYVLWWIAHSELEIQVRREPRRMTRTTRRDGFNSLFARVISNLTATRKFLDEDRKLQVDAFVAEYERLWKAIDPAAPGRRILARLNRLEVRIKRTLSPKHVLGRSAEKKQ